MIASVFSSPLSYRSDSLTVTVRPNRQDKPANHGPLFGERSIGCYGEYGLCCSSGANQSPRWAIGGRVFSAAHNKSRAGEPDKVYIASTGRFLLCSSLLIVSVASRKAVTRPMLGAAIARQHRDNPPILPAARPCCPTLSFSNVPVLSPSPQGSRAEFNRIRNARGL